MVANQKVRSAAKNRGIPLWKIAERMGISEPNISRRLRKELPAEDAERILELIKTIAAERGDE